VSNRSIVADDNDDNNVAESVVDSQDIEPHLVSLMDKPEIDEALQKNAEVSSYNDNNNSNSNSNKIIINNKMAAMKINTSILY